MAQSNSVTLSPAPSVDSQASSPQHAENQSINPLAFHSVFGNGSNGSGSNQSDSDEDSYMEQKYQDNGHQSSPPNTPGIHSMPMQIPLGHPPKSPKDVKEINIGAFRPLAREFFPVDSPEPNTSKFYFDFQSNYIKFIFL